MLCTKHFKKSSFIDNCGKRLFKSAVPDEECDKITLADLNLEQRNIIQHIAGELSSEAVTTANVIANMDKLFDCVNACTPDLRRGKPFSTNMTNNTPHLTHFTLMKKFFKEMTFLGC
ncbi:unnamed protein product [Parnassius mnemosyne]|uniref:THAP-type domain-containing protein n=1 Tax=Parnassius mnemosyne TaxID=213953 RepID=A0AAV1KLB9_9NEOP